MQAHLNIALRAGREGASVLAGSFDRLDRVKVLEQRGDDTLTSAHLDVEKTLLYQLQKTYPRHGFQSSASDLEQAVESDTIWFIDPLIGVDNFLRGSQGFLLGISCQVDGQTRMSLLIDPLLNEEFSAVRGSGASLNGHRIRVSNRTALEGSTLAVEFDRKPRDQQQAHLLAQALEQGAAPRTCGNGILDIAYTAAGRLDGGIAPLPASSSLAGAALLLREAGGLLSDSQGNPKLEGERLVFGNPKYFKQLLQLAR